jgi:hypothetical protein
VYILTFPEKNKIKHNFNRQNYTTGKDWLYNFLRKNPTISIRKTEATSQNRILGFNQEVARLYKNVEASMATCKFPSTHIYNMDENGVSTVQEPGVILAPKRRKMVGSVTSKRHD